MNLNSLNLEVLTAEKNELDLTDFSLVNNWFEKNKPEVVVRLVLKLEEFMQIVHTQFNFYWTI